jgi:hypothetical protein
MTATGMEKNYCDWMVIGGGSELLVSLATYITQAKFKTIAYSLALIPPPCPPIQTAKSVGGKRLSGGEADPDLTWTSTAAFVVEPEPEP